MRKSFSVLLLGVASTLALGLGACKGANANSDTTAAVVTTIVTPTNRAQKVVQRRTPDGPPVGPPLSAHRPPRLAELDTLLLRRGMLNSPTIRAYLAKTSNVQVYGSLPADSVAALRIAFVKQWMAQHPDSVALLSHRPVGLGMRHPNPGPRTGPTQRPAQRP